MSLLDAIERCEISFRTTWAYELAHLHGPQAYENNSIFKDQEKYKETMLKVDEEIQRSREDYIINHQAPGAARPPIWMACEVISLGHLSSLFANLACASDRNAIANKYALDEKNAKSFLHHLTIVRNLCAHHCRIWDRRFTIIFKLPRKKPPGLLINFNEEEPKRIYNSLVMLAYWLNIADPGNHWAKNIVKLLENDAFPFASHMGFPTDWRNRPIWKCS
jgi:abortive infection bacteriophage resistance protein